MKILIITPYFYYSNKKQFTKNNTGFGFLLKEIASYISNFDEVFVLSSVITKECEIDGFSVVSHSWSDVIINIKIKNLLTEFCKFLKVNMGVMNKIKHVFYTIDSGYTEYIIKKLKPDIVHFHAVGYRTELGINICERLKQKYVLTLHGLVGFVEFTPEYLKISERKLLKEASEKNIPVTVISTGIKNRIGKYYAINNLDNITVVTNGTDVNLKKTKLNINIRDKYQIPSDCKLMLCIGNISKRKNQEQLIRAFSLLDDKIKEYLYILIIGNIDEGLELNKLIIDFNLIEKIKLCGFVNKEELTAYYEEADYNAVVSKDEGFGLSMIEAFYYGIPTVTFSDLDAVPDLFDEKSMVLVNGRSDEKLAHGIEILCNSHWDRKFIKDYAKKFSLEIMAEKYHKVYIQALRDE